MKLLSSSLTRMFQVKVVTHTHMSCGKALNMLNGKFSASISMDSL
jgi:hypothetical protein